jgi:hypothetical protein
MIIRARPKFLTEEMFNRCKKVHFVEPEDNLYFSSGRTALFFLLKEYQSFFNKKIKIAMQSFNCSVVIESALQAGCEIFLIDIKKEDFSISLSQLKTINSSNDINAVIITHYQGIPNFEYEEIVEYARQYDMLIIEDVAQSYGSKIRENKIGTLGDVFIESYAFDKPFSCMYGGGIGFCLKNNLPFKFQSHLNQVYKGLPEENNSTAHNHINLLAYIFKNSAQQKYKKYLNNYDFLLFLLKFTDNNTLIVLISNFYRFLKKIKILSVYKRVKIVLHLSHANSFNSVFRLHPAKVNLIKMQKKEFDCQNLPAWTNSFYNLNDSEVTICWNRFSILDENGVIKKYVTELFSNDIELGNYNWPIPLHFGYKNVQQVNMSDTLINSEYCSKNILNIPIWQDK